MLKPKNILIFAVVGVVLVAIYIFFIKKSPEQTPLISTSSSGAADSSPAAPDPDSAMAQNFLSLLLNVKNIKLDDAIFSDPAFSTLRDSSIVLTPDGTEGRVNPFAPIGFEGGTLPANNTPGSTTVIIQTNPTNKVITPTKP